MPDLDPKTLANTLRTLDGRGLVEVARQVLRAETGGVVEIADGPWDGGLDLRVRRGLRELQVHAQCKSGSNWEREFRVHVSKMPSDATLWWFTTERVTEATRQKLKRELLDPKGIDVAWYDNHRIAAIALDQGFADVLLREARLPRGEVAVPVRRASLAERTAWSIAAFSEDAHRLRRSVDDAVVLDVVFDSGGRAALDDIVRRTRDRLGLEAGSDPRLRSAIERLRQAGRLRGPNGVVELSDEERGRVLLVRENMEREVEHLYRRLDEVARRLVPGDRREIAVEALMEHLGPLLLQAGARIAGSGSMEDVSGALQQLRLELHAHGVSEPEALLREATEAVRLTPFAAHLVTGEVWRRTAGLPRSALLEILGTTGLRGQPVVVLDANVAMPMLLGLEYSPPSLRFFLAARHVWEQASRLQLRMVVPEPWLEEMASQVVQAAGFAPVIAEDPDLVGSHNLFVSLYAALRRPRDRFLPYLEGFGLPRGLARGDFRVARDATLRGMKPLLAERGFHVEPFAAPVRREDEERWEFVHREAGLRPAAEITARHDLQVIAWLEQEHEGPVLLCTWHRMLHRMAERGAHGWDAVDPEALGDLLGLATDPDTFRPRLPELALAALSEDDHARGAAVWEQIVRLEREGLEDGDLRAQARAFKDDWLSRHRAGLRDDDLLRQWEAWKSRWRRSSASP